MRWFWLVVVGMLLCSADSTAVAQANSEEPAGYLQLIEAGLNEYYAHHFVEARALFAQAHALNPNARTLRVLGMAEFEMRRYPQSLAYLRAALVSTVHPLDADLRAHALELEKRALSFVGHVQLELQPATAEVLIDDAITALGAHGSLVVQSGEHSLEVRAATYRSEKRRLDIQGGEQMTLRIALSPELFPAKSAAQPQAQAKPTPLYASPWLWTGVGVVVLGAATALVFALRPASAVEFAQPQDTAQTPTGARIQALMGQAP